MTEDDPDAGGIERRPPSDPADRPIETWTHDELETLVTGFRPSAPPQVHAVNSVLGVADELGRLLMAVAIVLALLVGLAVAVTPWLWIGVVVWIGFAGATVGWLLSRRRRAPAPPARLDPPRT